MLAAFVVQNWSQVDNSSEIPLLKASLLDLAPFRETHNMLDCTSFLNEKELEVTLLDEISIFGLNQTDVTTLLESLVSPLKSEKYLTLMHLHLSVESNSIILNTLARLKKPPKRMAQSQDWRTLYGAFC